MWVTEITKYITYRSATIKNARQYKRKRLIGSISHFLVLLEWMHLATKLNALQRRYFCTLHHEETTLLHTCYYLLLSRDETRVFSRLLCLSTSVFAAGRNEIPQLKVLNLELVIRRSCVRACADMGSAITSICNDYLKSRDIHTCLPVQLLVV